MTLGRRDWKTPRRVISMILSYLRNSTLARLVAGEFRAKISGTSQLRFSTSINKPKSTNHDLLPITTSTIYNAHSFASDDTAFYYREVWPPRITILRKTVRPPAGPKYARTPKYFRAPANEIIIPGILQDSIALGDVCISSIVTECGSHDSLD